MRIDKFLKVSRILKRRSVACEVCSEGKVEVNGKIAKPSTTLKIGDIVGINYASGKLTFRVLALLSTTRKEDAEKLFEIISDN